MRELIREFIRIFVKYQDIEEPVYEFGSYQVKGQEGFADLRPLFKDKIYFGCDLRKGRGVDKVLDLHSIKLSDHTAGTVICVDTIEHVEYVRKATDEIHRILKPNGKLIISSVMDFPIHSHPNDYWRFTPEGFKSILKRFKNSYVFGVGYKIMPHTIVGIAGKGELKLKKEMLDEINKWKKRWVEQFNPNMSIDLDFE